MYMYLYEYAMVSFKKNYKTKIFLEFLFSEQLSKSNVCLYLST